MELCPGTFQQPTDPTPTPTLFGGESSSGTGTCPVCGKSVRYWMLGCVPHVAPVEENS